MFKDMFKDIRGPENVKRAKAAFNMVFGTMVQAVDNQDSQWARLIANRVDMVVKAFEAELGARKHPMLYHAVEEQDEKMLANTINDYFLAFTDNKELATNIVVVGAAMAELNFNFKDNANQTQPLSMVGAYQQWLLGA
jgi:hypothetical protein